MATRTTGVPLVVCSAGICLWRSSGGRGLRRGAGCLVHLRVYEGAMAMVMAVAMAMMIMMALIFTPSPLLITSGR